jgi:hypothetical protein
VAPGERSRARAARGIRAGQSVDISCLGHGGVWMHVKEKVV